MSVEREYHRWWLLPMETHPVICNHRDRIALCVDFLYLATNHLVLPPRLDFGSIPTDRSVDPFREKPAWRLTSRD